MTPRISVLVASYNQKRHLAEAIEGVLAQTLPPSQVIVVDDCSSDGSRDVIASYAARHPELIVPIYHGRNTGVAQARTDALGAVVGDYVTCIDGDDRWHSDKLRLEIATLRSHPDARWVYSGCSFIDQDGNVTGRFALPQEGREGCILVPTLCHEMALRDWLSETPLVRQVGLFDDNLTIYEDWDYKIRLAAAAPVVWVPTATVYYRRHGAGLSNSPPHVHLRSLEYVYRKHQSLIRGLPDAQRDLVLRARRRDLAGQSERALRYHVARRTSLDKVFPNLFRLLRLRPSTILDYRLALRILLPHSVVAFISGLPAARRSTARPPSMKAGHGRWRPPRTARREGEYFWEYIESRALGPGASLLAISPIDLGHRIYRAGDVCVKVWRNVPNAASERRTQDLRGEHGILADLDDIPGVPRPRGCGDEAEWSWLAYDFVRGTPLSSLLGQSGDRRRLASVVPRLARTALAVNARGVAHRDFRPSNVLVANGNKVFLIDFDQAIRAPWWRAFLVDIMARGAPEVRAKIPLRHLLRGILPPLFSTAKRWVKAPLRLLRGRPSEAESVAEVTIPGELLTDPEVMLMKRAWDIAAESNASSPGIGVSYYSLTFKGVDFPGERPWGQRWRLVSSPIDVKGKTILELGCNLGLFSVFMKLNGARRCLGVDLEPDIVEAAKLVAAAHSVDNEYQVVDLDSPESWEERLGEFDLVLALSVLNWVRDRKRLLRFLGRHKELVFEGHDDVVAEIAMLRAAGFRRVKVIGVSERGRFVLWGAKY